MRVRVLGPVDCVSADGTTVQIGSPTQRLVLAVLASRPGDVVPPGRLVDAVWGEQPPRSAEQSLRTYVSRLRHVLGGALASHPGGWALELGSDGVDAARFEQLAEQARQAADPDRRLELLADALSLWRGPAFGEFTDDATLRPAALRLTEIRDSAREARAATLVAAGRPAEAVASAEELLAEQPWREGTWVTLVEALAAGGRVSDALAAYRRAHSSLAEVGLEPSGRLRAAQTAALSGDAPPVSSSPVSSSPVSSSPVSSSPGPPARRVGPAAGTALSPPSASPGSLSPGPSSSPGPPSPGSPSPGPPSPGSAHRERPAVPSSAHAPTSTGQQPPSEPVSPDHAQAEHAASGEQQPTLPRPGLARLRTRRPVTSLVGRDDDLMALVGLVPSSRLVTLLGPGGVGKTRLAVELADRLADRFPAGVRIAELANVAEPAAVGTFVAEALGVDLSGGDVDDALIRAGAARALLVLDNCEHVVEAAAHAVALLIEHGDGIRVLATSRERLGVDGEHTRQVAPLAVDGPDAPASVLFRDRARAVRPDAITDGDAEALDRIVHRLDGIPLAIEMAAARLRGMTPSELADRLDVALDVLMDTRRAVAARHRTLTAVVAWSESLLPGDVREMLAALSVFAGPVGLGDVVAVTGRADALDVLTALVERSLVVVDLSGARARYGLLEIVREYARGRLVAAGALDRWSARHARHVLRVVREADALLRTPEEAAANQRLAGILDEARAARLWALDHDLPLAVALTARLHLFAHSRLWVEPLRWAVDLLAKLDAEQGVAGVPAGVGSGSGSGSGSGGGVSGGASGGPGTGAGGRRAGVRGWEGVDPGDLAAVHATAATWYLNTGELARAAELARAGVVCAGGRPERRFPLEVLSDEESFAGRLDESARLARELLTAADEAADPHSRIAGVVSLAISLGYAGARRVARDALALASAGSVTSERLAPSERAWLAYAEAELVLDDDPNRSLSLLERAVELTDLVDNRFLGGVARVSASSVQARCGDPDAAVETSIAVVRRWLEQRNRTHLVTTLRNIAMLFQRLDAPLEAAQLLGAVVDSRVKPSFGLEAERLAAVDSWADAALGQDEAARHRAAGAARGVDEAAETALAQLEGFRRPSI